MNKLYFTLGALSLLGTMTAAQAQFSLTLNHAGSPSNINVLPGQTATFNATLGAGAAGEIFLDGINLTLANNAFTTWQDGGTLFNAFPLSLPVSTSSTGNLFAIALSNAAPLGGMYTGNVSVDYRIGTNPTTFTMTKGFQVTSQTPTPPVILVTILSGIGTARMALKRRKKA